jgi:hypothetical protein
MKRLNLRLAALAAGTLAIAAAQAGEMTLYKQPNFSGNALTLRTPTENLAGAGFQDQVSSLRIRSGRWQVCTQPDFQGDCTVLDRGDYPALKQALNHRIESAREVERYSDSRDSGRWRQRDDAAASYGNDVRRYDQPVEPSYTDRRPYNDRNDEPRYGRSWDRSWQ